MDQIRIDWRPPHSMWSNVICGPNGYNCGVLIVISSEPFVGLYLCQFLGCDSSFRLV